MRKKAFLIAAAVSLAAIFTMNEPLNGTAAVYAAGTGWQSTLTAATDDLDMDTLKDWDRHKAGILDALNTLRDWGFSPMEIADTLFSRSGKSKIKGSAGAGTDKLIEDAKDVVEERTGQIVDEAKGKLEEKLEETASDAIHNALFGDSDDTENKSEE